MTRSHVTIHRLAAAILAAIGLAIVPVSCSSPEPESGTNTNWVVCKKDSDCTKVGTGSLCLGGRCTPTADGQAPADAATCEWPPNADTSVPGDGGFIGCRPAPACTGAACRSVCDGSKYPLTCHGTAAAIPDPSLGCTVVPIPTPSGTTIYCCPCASELGGPDSGGALPACTWPSSLDGDASSRATCHAGRALLVCAGATFTEECVSDNTTRCPDNQEPGPCKNQCRPDEYVAACGGVGPGPVPDPPAGCRSAGAVPAGVAYYCCPCGS